MKGKKSEKSPTDLNNGSLRTVSHLGRSPDPVAQPKKVKKNPHAVAMGRLGGKKGGKARAKNLSPEQLAEIGRMGAEKRWGKKRKE